MKLSGNRLRTGSGKILKFKSATARNKYEQYNQALKHGWKPTKKGKK